MDGNEELGIPISARRRFRFFVLIYMISVVIFGAVSEILRLLIKFL